MTLFALRYQSLLKKFFSGALIECPSDENACKVHEGIIIIYIIIKIIILEYFEIELIVLDCE